MPIDGSLFAIAQFESQPAAVYLTKSHQDRATGALTPVSTQPERGARPVEPCAGVVTPWNSHLGSEEHEPDAKKGAESAASCS